MNDVINSDYIDDLNKIKETIKQNQNKAMVIVNSAMIMTCYEIGTIINSRKTWGSKYIQKLSADLKEYGKGYSVRNLQLMIKVSKEFSIEEIMHQVGAQIPWRTIIEIMQKSTLDRINAKVGISKYKILEEVPKYLERKLNGV